MTAPHTPGPWRCTGGGYIGIIADVNGVSRQIGRAEVVGSPGVISSEECEANAALMSAAPDLLRAARAHLAHCREFGDCADAALMPGEFCSDGCADLSRAVGKAEDQT